MCSLPAKLFVRASDRLVFFSALPLELRCWPSPKPCAQHAAAGRRLLWRAPRPCSSAEGLQGRMHSTRRNISSLRVVCERAQPSTCQAAPCAAQALSPVLDQCLALWRNSSRP